MLFQEEKKEEERACRARDKGGRGAEISIENARRGRACGGGASAGRDRATLFQDHAVLGGGRCQAADSADPRLLPVST